MDSKVLRAIRITEKSTQLSSLKNQYVLEVDLEANHFQVLQAVKAVFNVHPIAVNLLRVEGKMKRSHRRRGAYSQMPDMKKAIITLPAGEKIESL